MIADAAGNNSAIESVITKFDLEKPTSTVLSPSAEFVNTLTAVSGEANDERSGARVYEAGLGTYTVKVAVRLVGGNWWSGSAFDQPEPSWFEAPVDTAPYSIGKSTLSWTYTLPGNLQSAIATNKRQNYRFVTYAYDLAFNKEFGP
ncbi:MAG: hypothetical protein COX65_08040, partial [Elusimicrobia bacterium CG_4_10_14_0_2_um_filter_56_8]